MSTKLNKNVFVIIAGVAAGASLTVSIVAYIPILNVILCCLCLVLPVFAGATGWYAADQHGVNKDKVVDGLITGLLGGLSFAIGWGIVSVIFTAIFSIVGVSRDIAVSSFFNDISSSEVAVVGAIGGGAGIVGAVFGFFISLVLYGVLGLIGGLIKAVTTEVVKAK